MDAEKLVGIRAKIERAKHHIADLDRVIRAFFDTHPYKFGAKRNPDTRELIYYVTNIGEVPADITQIAGDAIGNLVSILDHLAYRLYLKNTPGGSGRHVYFPIVRNAKSSSEYKSAREGKVKGIHPTVIAAIDAIEPYQGGKGHQIWVLNELNNLSKHRDLIAVGSMFWDFNFLAHALSWPGGDKIAELMRTSPGRVMHLFPPRIKPNNPLCPLHIGDILFVDAPDSEINNKIEFTFDIAINEPQIIQAEPLIETVHQLADLVDAIVTKFESFL